MCSDFKITIYLPIPCKESSVKPDRLSLYIYINSAIIMILFPYTSLLKILSNFFVEFHRQITKISFSFLRFLQLSYYILSLWCTILKLVPHMAYEQLFILTTATRTTTVMGKKESKESLPKASWAMGKIYCQEISVFSPCAIK